MTFNFEFLLTALVSVSGIIVLFNFILERYQKHQDMRGEHGKVGILAMPRWRHTLVDYAKSFFPILLLVLCIRTFVAEPFRIPSGSLEPTLFPGDFILVNKYTYGLRLPVTNTKIVTLASPKRGDIVVFRYPHNPSVDFIKRVIGLPGDHLSYIDKVLYVNNKKIKQVEQNPLVQTSASAYPRALKQEDLLGVKHEIFLRPDVVADDLYEIVVPQGHYFVMGDNRDESSDSRSWGYVPEQNLLGRAMFIWLSVDTTDVKARWNRIGKVIA